MPDARAVTSPPGHHFFGYYEKSPWNADETALLTHEVDFADRRPTPEDAARVCLVDDETGDLTRIASTRAWDFQQGSMLQWLGPDYDRRVVFNDREGGAFVARICDVETGETRTVPRPVYGVAPDGETAYTLDYGRLDVTRPGYGYASAGGDTDLAPHPPDDGVFRVSLADGDDELLVSLADLAAFDPVDSFDCGLHWVNHVQVSPGGERVAFIHRSETPGDSRWFDRLFAVGADGSDLRLLSSGFVSHYDWRTDGELVAWTREGDRTCFHRYRVGSGAAPEPFAPGAIPEDAHNSFSPDGRWMLGDTYPDEERRRHLFLWDCERGRRVDLGGFYSEPVERSSLRCDLHPRWDRRGERVCFDSTHEGTRQQYVLDVREHTT